MKIKFWVLCFLTTGTLFINGCSKDDGNNNNNNNTSLCSDGVQNGDETGVDCGGSCSPCPNELIINYWVLERYLLNGTVQEDIDAVKFSLDIKSGGSYEITRILGSATSSWSLTDSLLRLNSKDYNLILVTNSELHFSLDDGPTRKWEFTTNASLPEWFSGKPLEKVWQLDDMWLDSNTVNYSLINPIFIAGVKPVYIYGDGRKFSLAFGQDGYFVEGIDAEQIQFGRYSINANLDKLNSMDTSALFTIPRELDVITLDQSELLISGQADYDIPSITFPTVTVFWQFTPKP